MNKTTIKKQLKEMIRDYEGTYKAWEHAINNFDIKKANELREQLVIINTRIGLTRYKLSI